MVGRWANLPSPTVVVGAYRPIRSSAIAGQKIVVWPAAPAERFLTTTKQPAKMGTIDDGFEALLEPFYNGKSLTDPISTREDKYQLLPAFLKVKGESAPHWKLLGG